jgi:hypothetical protein
MPCLRAVYVFSEQRSSILVQNFHFQDLPWGGNAAICLCICVGWAALFSPYIFSRPWGAAWECFVSCSKTLLKLSC